jgi:hypothetical protein
MLINNKILEIYQDVEKSESEIDALYARFKTSLPDPYENEPVELFNPRFIEALTESIKKNLELNIYDRNIATIINLFKEGEFSAAIIEIIRIQDDPKYIKFKKPLERLVSTTQLLKKNFRDVEELEEFIKERERDERFKREFKPFYGSGI